MSIDCAHKHWLARGEGQTCGRRSRILLQILDCTTVLKVESNLYVEDAELLERICRDIGKESHGFLTLDLADLSFLDSESATVLCRLRREQGVRLEGLHLFIEKVVELTEAEATVSKYLQPGCDASSEVATNE